MKNALITGTTSGIGKAFAEKFASIGNNIILVSRDKQKLEQQQLFLQNQYHVTVNFIAYDLTKEDAVNFIMEQIEQWGISVHILINNAGFNECGFFKSTNLKIEVEMINLHIRFVTQLTKCILTGMDKNGYGQILNVGSTGSFIPSPTDAVYSATKAYIISFSNALCGECRKTGIRVSTLCSGATRTEFASKANIENTLLFKLAVMKPEKVVEIAYPKLMKGKRIIVPGLYNKFLVFCSKVIPVNIMNRMTMYMMRMKLGD